MAASSPRLRAPWLFVGMLLASFFPSVAIPACIEYSDYIHWKSEVYVPDGGSSIAVGAVGSQACLSGQDEFGEYFRTIDLSSPLSPVIAGTLAMLSSMTPSGGAFADCSPIAWWQGSIQPTGTAEMATGIESRAGSTSPSCGLPPASGR